MLVDNDNRSYSPNDLTPLNMLMHPVWVFDLERKAKFWANQAALVIWDADTLQSLLDRDFSEMSEAAEIRSQELLAKITRNEIVTEQWTFYPRGLATTLRVTGSAIRIDGGRIALLVETELPAKNEFEESTVRGIEMLRHIPVAVSQFSMEGKLEYQNPKAVKLFGATAFENITEKVQDMFLSRFIDQELGKTALQQVQAGNDFSAEAQHRTQEGPRWFSVEVRRTKDPVTSKYVILYTARDISDIITARKEATQAAMKHEFIAIMAHEIRTPLHQVVGFLDLLEQTQLSEEQLEFVRHVQSSTALLMSIINDLLDYSKLECGKIQVGRVSFPLAGLLNGCLASVKPHANQKRLTLQGSFANNLPSSLVGDPNRLRQILLNLLSNAVKFTNHGFVRLTATCVERSDAGQRLRFEVTDSGIGIDACEQKIVFDKYGQANASVARHFGGTGLGLSICKGLAELMGGSIGLDSQVGQGTTMFFEILFQLPSAVKDSAEPEERTTPVKGMKRLRLLVVEDNTINQKVVCSMLQRIGDHTVAIAENGQLALDELRTTRYDLVLMDIQMPVMDGIECTKQIRSKLGLCKVTLPIVGLTASYQHSDLKYYEEIGMNMCLGKPLRMDQLKRAITVALQTVAGVDEYAKLTL